MSDTVDWNHWNRINAALQRFADAFDRADLPALLGLFAPDAVWDHHPGHGRRGHQEIGAFLSERFAVYAATSHHVGPPVVRAIAGPARFESVAYLIAAHQLKDGTSYTGHGRYVTAFRDVGTAMLITSHTVIAHVTYGASAPVNQLARQPG